jgi:hypothetical protein
MLRFNTLLHDEGVDPKNVKLVRHQDSRAEDGCTPYELWCTRDGRFDFYQTLQSSEVFNDRRQIAAFVRTPNDETLFVGVYEIDGQSVAPEGTTCRVTKREVGGHTLY